jgi:tRNA (cytidine/uridine-2'-O-)-methyltransferase
MTDKQLRRAGLDYHEFANVEQHPDLETCLASINNPRVFALSTRGTTRYASVQYQANDALLFGPETRGLPVTVLDNLPTNRILRIPMNSASRSLNLSNAAAVVVYEGLRQQDFPALM